MRTAQRVFIVKPDGVDEHFYCALFFGRDVVKFAAHEGDVGIDIG